MSEIKALFFDVFGTVVDWRGSVARLGAAMADEIAAPADLDWTASPMPGAPNISRRWRRCAAADLARLDLLHRENLTEFCRALALITLMKRRARG